MTHPASPHFGICVRNYGCEDLQLRKLYQILPDESAEANGFTRVIDDSGEDYLYPADNFIPVALPASVEQALASIPTDTRAR